MSRDVNERLQRTADEPTRPLDTAAVVGRARRQTRLARAGLGLGAVVVVVLASVVALPLVTGIDQQLEIADRPGPGQVTDRSMAGGFTLGENYVWRSLPGSPIDAGLAFAAEVLGWEDASIIERGGAIADDPPDHVRLVIASVADRTVELVLEASDTVAQVWDVIQVAAGVEQPISLTADPSMFWRPHALTTERYRPFEGITGVAYIRTIERGTVTIDLDTTAVTDADISLEGHVDVGEPFCHNIQSTLLLFHDHAGEVVSAVGGVWYGDDPPDCDLRREPSELVPPAEEPQRTDEPAVTPLVKAEGWRDELAPATVVSILEIALDRQTAARAWEENAPAGLADVAGDPKQPGIYAGLEDVDFDTHAVAVWSSRQWADCPGWVSDVEGDGTWLEVRRGVAAASGEIEGSPGQRCSGEPVPYRMLIAVDRDRLPDTGRLPMTDLTGVYVASYPADFEQSRPGGLRPDK